MEDGMSKNQMESVMAKMRENNLKDFSDDELQRVFKNTVSPTSCIRGARVLIQNGLTIESLYTKVGVENEC